MKRFRVLFFSYIGVLLVLATNVRLAQANPVDWLPQSSAMAGTTSTILDINPEQKGVLSVVDTWVEVGGIIPEDEEMLDGSGTPVPTLLEGCEITPVMGVVASCAESIIPKPSEVKFEFAIFLPSVLNNNTSPSGGTLEQTKSSVNSTTYADQKFGDIPTYSNYLADDFLIASPGYNLTEIFIPGNLYNGGTTLANATHLVFQIYTDNAGKPAGDPVNGGAFWSLSVVPGDSRITLTQSAPLIYGNVKLILTSPLNLAPGRYWLVFYPEMNVLLGQYGRYVSDTVNGNDAVVMNPGGGFLPLATTWTSIQDPAAWGTVQQDLAFRLKGTLP
jgi:hypothetical protein